MTDVQGVWELPVAILLPPFYALVVPIARVFDDPTAGAPRPRLPPGIHCRGGRALLWRRIGSFFMASPALVSHDSDGKISRGAGA